MTTDTKIKAAVLAAIISGVFAIICALINVYCRPSQEVETSQNIDKKTEAPLPESEDLAFIDHPSSPEEKDSFKGIDMKKQENQEPAKPPVIEQASDVSVSSDTSDKKKKAPHFAINSKPAEWTSNESFYKSPIYLNTKSKTPFEKLVVIWNEKDQEEIPTKVKKNLRDNLYYYQSKRYRYDTTGDKEVIIRYTIKGKTKELKRVIAIEAV